MLYKKGQRLTVLALGDSYTIGEGVSSGEKYIELLQNYLHKEKQIPFDYKIIAQTGWTTTELLNALKREKDSGIFDFIFLLIGVNNQYQHLSLKKYMKEFETLLHKCIMYSCGNADHVFVLSIPDYSFTPFAMEKKLKVSLDIEKFNEENKKITLSLNANYINITDLSLGGLEDASLLAADRLHPSKKMYEQWVERIYPAFLEKLQEKFIE